MKRADIQDILQPLLAARLHPLTDADIGNGTPLADAVASALAFDLATGCTRIMARAQEEVDALTDDQLRDAIELVRDAIAINENRQLGTLPHGATVKGRSDPGLDMARVQPTKDPKKTRTLHAYMNPLRGIPGLHEYGDRGLPERPGAERLRHEIARQLATLPACDVAPAGVDDIKLPTRWKWRDTLELPIRGGPGTTFLHSEHITMTEKMLDIDIALQAAATRELVARVIKDRDKVDRAYGKMVAEFQGTMDKAKAEGVPFTFNGIHIHERHGTTHIDAQFSVLGNDLEPTTWIAPDYGAGLKKAVENQLGTQRKRKRILDEAGAAGGRGRVDQITLNAIRALTDDPEALLRRIARDRNVTIDAGRNGKKTDPVRLAWKNGRVESSFALTDKASWNYTRLIFKGVQLPEAVLMTLPGKPISTLVEHPFLEGDHVIRSARCSRWGALFANIGATWTIFDAETGKTIDLPAEEDAAEEKIAVDEVVGGAEAPRQGDLLDLL